MRKKLWAWLMTLVMVVSMVPATAFAVEDTAAASPYTVTNQEAIQPAATGGVYLNKQLDLNENGEGTITLQTYVEGSVHTTAKAVDFVLVLDMSTSMKEKFSGSQTVYNEVFVLDKSKTYYVSGYYGYTEVEWCDGCNAWTSGCRGIITHRPGTAYEPRTVAAGEGTQFYTRSTVASMTRLDALKSAASNFITTVASEAGDHRIALVGFEDKAQYLTGGTAATAFKDASGNETSLKGTISGIDNNDLEPATEHGKGLAYAENIFAADTATDRERVVIMFTDGEPEPNGSGNWSSSIVSGAVNSAYNLKNTHKASVYCISVLPGAEPDGTANMDKYMNYVSSNYKVAQYTGDYSGTNQASIIAAITPGEGTYGGKYYQVAANLENLNEIFGSISSDVQSIQLDEETVITDVMSDYFVVNGAAGDVQLYVSDYTGKDGDGIARFGEQTAAEGVTATINDGVVSVNGFGFEPVIDNEDGTAKSGKMLTIVVPVKLDQDAAKGMSGETVPSNNTENEKAAITNDGETVAEFAVPAVTLPKEKIVITAASAEKTYDGTALTNAGYTYTTGVLAEGDVLTAVVAGTQKDAGRSANTVTSFKVMRGETDVTDKYDISTVNGTLTVNKRDVILTSATDSKVYDGTLLTNSTVTVGGSGFANGEGASYDVTGSQLDPGSSKNAFSYTLNEGTNADNYNITTVEGDLTVTKITEQLLITADSNTKMYDGEALTDNGYTFTEDVLVEGDELVVEIEGEQTNVGESANVVESYKVMRGETDVTKNYTIATADGKLTVTPRPVTLTSATDSKVYDGTPLTNDKVTVGGEGFVKGEGASYDVTGSQLDVGTSDNTFTYELKNGTLAENYEITVATGTLTVTPVAAEIVIKADSNTKMYDGKALTDDGYTYTEDVLIDGDVLTAVVEGEQTNVGEAANVVKSYKVMRGEKDVTGNYTFGEAVDGTLEVTPRPVTLTSATDSKVYDGTPLTNSKVAVGGEGFVEGEGASYDVTGSQTYVGSSENTFTYELNEGTKAANYVITTVNGKLTVTPIIAEIVITADSNEKVYDGTALTDDGYTFTEDVLVKGDVLTAVVEGTQTDAGESANVVTSYKVMRGDVDVTDNYTFGESVDGTLAVKPRPVKLTSGSAEKEYDGKPLTNDEITVGGEGFVDGEGVTFDVTGSQLDVGSSANTFTYELNEGTKAENYVITTEEGTLTVTKAAGEIVVTADSSTKVYDGTALTDDGYTFDESKLKNGDVLTAVVEGSQTDAGTADNTVTEVVIMRGDKDVTANYNIATADGTLTVTKRPVTLTSATDSKVYDGTPLTNDEITVGGEGFAEGEGAAYDVTGSQLDAGSSDNTFTYALNEGTKADNYEITTAEGTLTVTPVGTEIIIQADSNTKMYDGTPLTDDDYTFTEGVLVKGDELVVVVEGSQTDAGESVNTVASYKVMRGEEDVTANYKIATADGKLTVTPRVITLTSATETKFYDGTPLTNNEITVSGDGFAAGEGLVYNVTGTVTNVAEGAVANEFTYEAAAGTDLNNYKITTAFGALEIAPVKLIVTADDKSKMQGEENPELTGTITGFVNDETPETALTGDAEYTTTAEKDSKVGEYTITAGLGNLEAVNGNYIFEFVDGTLTVTEKPVPPAKPEKPEPPAAEPTEPETPDDNAQTGDDFNIWLYAGLAFMALITAIAALARRQRQ